MKKIFLILIFVFLILPIFNVQAQEKPEINFFYSPACQHCKDAHEFLDGFSGIEINKFEASKNSDLLKEFYEKYQVPKQEQGFVPIIFTQEKYFLGFNDTVAQELEACIEACVKGVDSETRTTSRFEGWSPLGLSVVLGALDGFNACAMIALGFLLTMLIASGIRKKMILIGGVFIFVSGVVYFVFISAWLNLFIVLEQLKFITYLVAAIIIMFSVFMLKDYVHGIICKICAVPSKKDSVWTKFERWLFAKMQKLTESKIALPVLLLGVAAVAAGINLVELVCSFGFPLAFTKNLVASGISGLKYYFYIFVYVLFYMLDDFLIFLIALWTLKITNVSEKYLKVIKLISAIVLLLLGLIMLIKPGLLVF